MLSTEYTECQALLWVVRIGSPLPLSRKRVLLPPFGSKRRNTLAMGERVCGPNSNEGTDTLVLYVYYNTSKMLNDVSEFPVHGGIDYPHSEPTQNGTFLSLSSMQNTECKGLILFRPTLYAYMAPQRLYPFWIHSSGINKVDRSYVCLISRIKILNISCLCTFKNWFSSRYKLWYLLQSFVELSECLKKLYYEDIEKWAVWTIFWRLAGDGRYPPPPFSPIFPRPRLPVIIMIESVRLG
jgi:hypothetical protein